MVLLSFNSSVDWQAAGVCSAPTDSSSGWRLPIQPSVARVNACTNDWRQSAKRISCAGMKDVETDSSRQTRKRRKENESVAVADRIHLLSTLQVSFCFTLRQEMMETVHKDTCDPIACNFRYLVCFISLCICYWFHIAKSVLTSLAHSPVQLSHLSNCFCPFFLLGCLVSVLRSRCMFVTFISTILDGGLGQANPHRGVKAPVFGVEQTVPDVVNSTETASVDQPMVKQTFNIRGKTVSVFHLQGYTALHLASIHGHQHVVHALIHIYSESLNVTTSRRGGCQVWSSWQCLVKI